MTEPARLLDVNVLVALTKADHVHADAAHHWFASLPPGTTWCTCPTTEASYLRLMTNAAVAGVELAPREVLGAACDAVLATFDSRLVDSLAGADRRFVELIAA